MEEKKKPDVTPEEKKETKTTRRSKKSEGSKKTAAKDATPVTPSETIEQAETVDSVTKTEVTAEEQKAAPKKSGRRGANVKALELELEKQKQLTEEAQDRYKRLLAEFENARSREAKEATRMYDVGAKEVLEKLLPVVDNFERALESVPEENKDNAFEQGIDKIYKQLMTSLEGVGVVPMNAVGTEFDPNLHNAVMHVEDDSVGDNVITEEMQKGYMYKESVLRYSMVTVAN